MKLKEVLEKLDTFSDSDRKKYCTVLMEMATNMTQGTLQKFQEKWDIAKPFPEFKAAQNKELRNCFEMEASKLGAEIRKMQRLPVLNMETDITVVDAYGGENNDLSTLH